MHVQEKTFVNWCNLFLKTKGFQIKSIDDLKDGVCILIILQNISRNDWDYVVGSTADGVARNWKRILEFLEGENIHVTESPDTVDEPARKFQIITLVLWRIILRYQICDQIPISTKLNDADYSFAPKRLLKWAQLMLPDRSITNFDSDWTNGTALCDLVNAIRPGTIPKERFADWNNDEINVRLACTAAEDELSVPELISPWEIANGLADERCLMIYLALLRSASKIMMQRTKNDATIGSEIGIEDDCKKNHNILVPKSEGKSNGISYQRPKCVAFGAGLRWGQVGKPSEFFVQSNGPEFADLSISIECRPLDNRSTQYRPGLQIKYIITSCYMVRYTPTRPGEYILNIVCSGEHIPSSPFRLNVHETILSERFQPDKIVISFNPTKVMFTGSHLLERDEMSTKNTLLSQSYDSAFGDDDELASLTDTTSKSPLMHSDSFSSLFNCNSYELLNNVSDSIASKCNSNFPGNFKSDGKTARIYGRGLKAGEVGLVSSFQVYTPNSEKGPLAVSITCPAMSIPVPSVTTTLHATYMKHDVVYLPTEPGGYQVEVTWGAIPIGGSPYYLSVVETRNSSIEEKELENENKTKEARITYFRPTGEHSIIIYYSATTTNTTERANKCFLEGLLRKENPLDSLICVTIDLEIEQIERKKIFGMASTKKLPMVFVNDKYFGTFEDVMILYTRGTLTESLLKCTGND